MRDFLRRLGPQDRVLFVGDSRPRAGGQTLRPFEQLQRAGMRTANVDEILHPQERGLKRAVPFGYPSISPVSHEVRLDPNESVRLVSDPGSPTSKSSPPGLAVTGYR
jgi:hypothetical protein